MINWSWWHPIRSLVFFQLEQEATIRQMEEERWRKIIREEIAASSRPKHDIPSSEADK